MPDDIWYASYDAKGNPPKCSRLTRLAPIDQLGMAFDLAIDILFGGALCSSRTISATGERYWYWPEARHAKYGDWWLLPERTHRLAEQAIDYARQRADDRDSRRIDQSRFFDLDAELRTDTFRIDRTTLIYIELLRLRRRAYRARERLHPAWEPAEFEPFVARKKWIAILCRYRISDDPWRGYPKGLRQANRDDDDKYVLIRPDSGLMRSARRAQSILLEGRYDRPPPLAGRRYEQPHPRRRFLVEMDSRDVPIVEAARIWGAEA